MGQRLELRCSLAAQPSANITSITWSNNSTILANNTNIDFLTHTIDPVTSADAGAYTCSITYGDSTLNRTYEFTPLQGIKLEYNFTTSEKCQYCRALYPLDPLAKVSGNRNNFVVNESITLTCVVSGADSLDNHTEIYVWRRDSVILTGQVEASLTLGPLKTDDSGSYTCTVTINDTFLSSPINATSAGYNITISSKCT